MPAVEQEQGHAKYVRLRHAYAGWLTADGDVMRVLTIKVDKHEEGPSAVLQARSQRDERDRDRGPRRPRREDEN